MNVKCVYSDANECQKYLIKKYNVRWGSGRDFVDISSFDFVTSSDFVVYYVKDNTITIDTFEIHKIYSKNAKCEEYKSLLRKDKIKKLL